MLETRLVETSCPYCGEWLELVVDASIDSQSYIEDCQVCCQPITVHCEVDAMGEPGVWTAREDD